MNTENPTLSEDAFFRFCKKKLEKLADEGVADAKRVAEEITPLLMSFGYGPRCLVGDPRFQEKNVDQKLINFWFIGQFLEIVQRESWWAMNSYLNSLDRLVVNGE